MAIDASMGSGGRRATRYLRERMLVSALMPSRLENETAGNGQNGDETERTGCSEPKTPGRASVRFPAAQTKYSLVIGLNLPKTASTSMETVG